MLPDKDHGETRAGGDGGGVLARVGFGEEVEPPKQRELAEGARPRSEQFQYQAYVRQTWDISRFIKADGSRQFEAPTEPPGQSAEGREPLEFRQPAIGKYWEEFNDFYIAFI